MANNVPLTAVQKFLGHKTPNLTSSYVDFSEDEMQFVVRQFMEKEAKRKTSARNPFWGRIKTIIQGDIQTRIEIATLDGLLISSTITSNSIERLGLQIGRLITAEVKAPWIVLFITDTEPRCSTENCFQGSVTSVAEGTIMTECLLQITKTIEICAPLAI